ncbi:MAG: hypothetical protein OEY77_01630 [Nitrospira sp.]|nr:hypothetical protein [Nitrospira sp.]
MISSWEQTFLGPVAALSEYVLSLLPHLLSMIIILLAGLGLAWGIGHLIERLLRVIGLDRIGIAATLMKGGIKANPSSLIDRLTYWLIVLFAVTAALGTLNVTPINEAARSLLSYLPHVITAAAIGIAGYLIANFVSQAVLIAAVNAGIPPARWVAIGTRWGIQLLAIAMALEQLGIARHIVVVGFGITWGGLVLAAALAVGLGGQELAKDFLERRLGGHSRT